MVMPGEIRWRLVGSPKQVVNFLAIVDVEDMLSARVYEILVNVVHDII